MPRNADSLEALARVLPWDQVAAHLGEDIHRYRCEDVVAESVRSGVRNGSGSGGNNANQLVKEMQMTVEAIMTFMFTCQNATIPVSIVQTYKDASKAFQESLVVSVAGKYNAGPNVVQNVRTFRATIAELTAAARRCANTGTSIYQKAATWVNYIISFATIHSVLAFNIGILSRFHASALNYSAHLQWTSALVYEGCRVAGMSDSWARWMLTAVSWGIYTVGPNGVVTKSPTAEAYVAFFTTHIRGRFMQAISKILLAMLQYAIRKAGSCSRNALDVYASVFANSGSRLHAMDKMVFILFIVTASLIATRKMVGAVRLASRLATTPAEVGKQFFAFVNDLAIAKPIMNRLKRKRPIARRVDLPTAINRANRALVKPDKLRLSAKKPKKSAAESPTRYYNAQNLGNSNNEYFNARNWDAENLENVVQRFGRLTL